MDWQAYFDERAAIREHDGHVGGTEAARLAFEDAVAQWLSLNPPAPSEPAHGCVHCTNHQSAGDPLLPVVAQGGHVWVHERCHPAWLIERRKSARAHLAQIGIEEVAP